MRLGHVAFSCPVPPPAGDIRTSVRHLQSDRADHGASYWPELYLESGYIVAGEARYPIATVARVLVYREPEPVAPPPPPRDVHGAPILPACVICGAALSDRQALDEQRTCGRQCGGALRSRERRAEKKARAGMGVDAGHTASLGGGGLTASGSTYRNEEHGQ